MKKLGIVSLSAAVLLLVFGQAMAQGGRFSRQPGRMAPEREAYGRMQQAQQAPAMMQRGHAYMFLQDLTEEQKAKMEALHAQRLEKSLKHRNQMDALRVKKQGLLLEKSPNLTEVNKIIDEMAALNASWMKEGIAHRQEIRKLLTDEQRARFDSQHHMRGAAAGMRHQAAPGGRGRK